MATKKRLRLKKKVLYIGIFILIVIFIATYLGTKYYKDYKYKQTNEYKLIEHGYTKEDALELLNIFNTEEEIKYLLDIKKNDLILSFTKEKYYLKKNLERYLNYAEKNKDKDTKEIITLVNVNREYNYYEHDIESNIEKGILLNVNKYYKLSNEYEPVNLVKISTKYAYDGNSITKEANDAYISMWNAANKEGLILIVNSSFRSYASQEKVYNSIKNTKGIKEADKTSARPGYSEHQTGLSIDVFEKNNQTTATFKDSLAYTWLQENAYKYGFIERYPEGKENITGYSSEAWHWRYVGETAAKIIHDENITFDEYYAFYEEM